MHVRPILLQGICTPLRAACTESKEKVKDMVNRDMECTFHGTRWAGRGGEESRLDCEGDEEA